MNLDFLVGKQKQTVVLFWFNFNTSLLKVGLFEGTLTQKHVSGFIVNSASNSFSSGFGLHHLLRQISGSFTHDLICFDAHVCVSSPLCPSDITQIREHVKLWLVEDKCVVCLFKDEMISRAVTLQSWVRFPVRPKTFLHALQFLPIVQKHICLHHRRQSGWDNGFNLHFLFNCEH